jgi:uncharacterized protein YuzB (UPF0349 family)
MDALDSHPTTDFLSSLILTPCPSCSYDQVALVSDMDASDGHGTIDAKSEPAVKLMTVHAAKVSG